MTDNPKIKVSRSELASHVDSFVFKPISAIPFTMTTADIKERNRFRRNIGLFFLFGGIGNNAIGFHFAKKYPKYRKYIIPYFAGTSILLAVGGYLAVMKEARKYIIRKIRGNKPDQ